MVLTGIDVAEPLVASYYLRIQAALPDGGRSRYLLDASPRTEAAPSVHDAPLTDEQIHADRFVLYPNQLTVHGCRYSKISGLQTYHPSLAFGWKLQYWMVQRIEGDSFRYLQNSSCSKEVQS
jgi:hypothetical protein